MTNYKFKIILFFIITLFISSCNNDKSNSNNGEIAVNVMEASIDSFDKLHDYMGVIEENSSILLSFEVGGNIESIFVTEGQSIAKGQVVSEINKEASQNAYELAKSTLDRAEDGYKRAEQVYNNGSLAEVKWIEIQTQLSQARASEKIARRNLDNCVLRSPQSGVVGELMVSPGMNILPYQPAFKLMDITIVKASVNVPEKEISKISVGQNAEVRISAVSEEAFKGKVIEKGVSADKLSHSYVVKIGIDNTDKRLMPGMTCRANITTGKKYKGFKVPVNAVQLSNDGSKFVWVVEDGKSTRKIVEVGDLIDNHVIITSGIKENEKIIVNGFTKVSEGSKVKIQ